METAEHSRAAHAARNAGKAMEARYRSGIVHRDGPWNDTLALMLDHRSVRAYSPEPLPEGALERIVAAAQSAATSSNMQTWSVVAVENPERKARLAAVAGQQAHVLQCPVLLVFLADHSRVRSIAAQAGQPVDALDYLESFLVAAIDAALAAQNAMLAAQSFGLGAVYIGALRNNPQAVAAELALPHSAAAMFGMCLGYPLDAGDVKPRLPQGAILHREQYGDTLNKEMLDAYNRDLMQFQCEQNMKPNEWTETVLGRFRGAANLNGRDRLKEALLALGFGLK